MAQLVKNPPLYVDSYFPNAGNPSLIPGLGRSSAEGNGNALQYSGLENSKDYTVHGVAKSQTQLSDFHSKRQLFTQKKRKKKRNLLPSNRNYHVRRNSLRMTQTNSTQRMDFTFSRHLNMCCTILCLSMIWEERRELSEEG